MGEAFLVNIADRPDTTKPGADGKRRMPGVPNAPVLKTTATVKYLGREGDQEGPYVYYTERPKGDVVPFHRHSANRIEFLIEGRIEWRERGKPPVAYGAGSLSYVDAGVIYGYEVLEDAKILIIFESAPGVNMM